MHRLPSSAVGADFEVFVGRCGTDADGAPPAGVLYLTDADGCFGLAVDVVRGLQLKRHLPPLLVVGVGYGVGPLAEAAALRVRDLTPTADPAYAALVPAHARMGGGPAFLSFLRHELRPWVADRYGVDADDATFFGHSMGGLLGAWALLQEPTAFRRWILGSPSLWWDDRVLLREEERYAAGHDDLPADVYAGIGADETHEGRVREAANLPPDERALATAWYIDMVDDLAVLAARLLARGYPTLRLRHEVLPGEFHVSVAPLILSRGLRHLFDAPS